MDFLLNLANSGRFWDPSVPPIRGAIVDLFCLGNERQRDLNFVTFLVFGPFLILFWQQEAHLSSFKL